MILDTCFFVDLQRRPDLVKHVVPSLATTQICTTVITCGELAVGMEAPSTVDLQAATLGLPVLGIDQPVAITFGALMRSMRARGTSIGENDAWIAAIALVHQLPLLTRNVREFSRIPGLTVQTY